MRNIWGWVVGVIVVVGAGIALYDVIGGSRSTIEQARQPVASPSEAEAAEAAPPSPSKHFDDIKIRANDFILGSNKAPVTIVEYASMTCPHCAHFQNAVLPTLKKEYVETGKVRIVYRDFPLDQIALRAAMLARCAGRDRYFGFVDAIFGNQNTWARDPKPIEALSRIALLGGMNRTAFDACMKNQQVADAVLKQRLEGDKSFEVNSTPTIIVNGDKYDGAPTLDQMRAIIDAKLKK